MLDDTACPTVERIGERLSLAAFAARLPQSHMDVLRLCFDSWSRLATQPVIPRKRDFEVTRMPYAVWPSLFLLEAFDRGRQFRYKVVGTRIAQTLGYDVTGALAPAWCCSEDADMAEETYRLVTMTRQPDLMMSRVHDRRFLGYTRLALPLAGDNGQTTHILGAVDFYTLPVD